MKHIIIIILALLIFSNTHSQNSNSFHLKDKFKPYSPPEIELTPINTNDSISRYTAKVWPNPSIETFTIKVESPSNQDIIILISDLSGKKVAEFTIENTATFSFGEMYPPGLYIMRLKQDSEIRSTFKLIKQ